MKKEWNDIIWQNKTAYDYLYYLPKNDIWSLPLEEWIYHSVAECALLYGAITNKVAECCEPLLEVVELEELYNNAIKSIRRGYSSDFKDFASYRLIIKMNDLLYLVDNIDELINEDADIWERAIYSLADDIESSGITSSAVKLKRNTVKYALS